MPDRPDAGVSLHRALCERRRAVWEEGMLQQVEDLRTEADELHRLLATLDAEGWNRATLFKSWTINDIVQHLHMGDTMGLASATDTAAFDALVADIQAR